MNKPIAVQTSDTLEASCWCVTYMHRYMAGEYPPHYPMPVRVSDYEPSNLIQWLWVHTRRFRTSRKTGRIYRDKTLSNKLNKWYFGTLFNRY